MAYYFRLPIITALTIQQQAVLNEPGAVAVSGGPGTGKSVVSLWRHIRNHDTGRRRSLLLTYTKSLEYYLTATARAENENAGNCVNRTYWWTCHNPNTGYAEIIVDEAQDVEEEKYLLIQNLTQMVSYSADDNQMLFPSRHTSQARLREIFGRNHEFNLEENYRNTFEITQLVRSLFPQMLIANGNEHGPKPTVILSGSNIETQIKISIEIINLYKSDTHNIAIILPLAGPNSRIYQTVEFWYGQLNGHGFACSKYTNREEDLGVIENVHVTTFKSAKGLEFDTLIVPNFNQYRENIENLRVVEENDYYVVLTRAKRNLFLIDNDVSSNNRCNLPFLHVAVQRELVQTNIDYITKNTEETILPF